MRGLASRLDHFSLSGYRVSDTRCVTDLTGPQRRSARFGEEEVSCLRLKWDHDLLVLQSVARSQYQLHYPDCFVLLSQLKFQLRKCIFTFTKEGYRYKGNGISLDPSFSICFGSWKPKELRGDADKSLARSTSPCRRTELIVSLERGVCSCA